MPPDTSCLAMIAVTAPQITLQDVAGTTGNEIDRAGIGVTAIERALRPANNLDALQIIGIKILNRTGIVDAVYKVCRAGFDPELHARKDVGLAPDDRAFRRCGRRQRRTKRPGVKRATSSTD